MGTRFYILRVLFLKVIFLAFPFAVSEFRFCYKGPQRLTELDCPGGFIAKEKLNISCAYFARTKNVSTATAKFTGDLCDDATMVDVDVLAKNEDDLASFGASLHQAIFEIDDSILEEGDIGGKYEPEDVCFTSCLPEWQDPEAVEDEPFLDEGNAKGPTVDEGKVAMDLNKQVFLSIMDDDDDDEEDHGKVTHKTHHERSDPFKDDVDDGHTSRIAKLLAKSMRIVVGACAPYVEENFYRQVYKAMMYLSKKNESLVEDVTATEYKAINAALNRCLQKRNLGFNLNGTVCDGRPKVDGVFFYKKQEYWKYRLTSKSWRYQRHNPYIEAAWNSIEFVAGYCFESFVYNMMDLHTYTVALEGFFPAMVLKHWTMPFFLKSDIFWNNVLETKDLNNTMKNIDACVIGGNSMSPYSKRMERPYVQEDASRNPSVDSTIPVIPLEKGWTKKPEEYWEWYDRKGGFKSIGKNFGICVDTDDSDSNKDEMEELVDKIKEQQCPVVP